MLNSETGLAFFFTAGTQMFVRLLLRFSLIGFVGCASVLTANAQDRAAYSYDTDLLPSSFFVNRRDALRSGMPDSSMAVLFTAPVRNRSRDVDYPFHQDPDFYYLTGFREPHAVLFIFKHAVQLPDGSTVNEFLVIRDRRPEKEMWTGKMPDRLDAMQLSGIKHVLSSSDETAFDLPYSSFSKVLYKGFPKGVVDDKGDAADLHELLNFFKVKSGYPAPNGDDFKLGKMLAAMREVKTEEELVLLQKSVDISIEAHRQMMRAAEPGMKEHEVEAAGEYVFLSRGAEEPGYPSICGGGPNSCVLHYEKNRKILRDGELLLIDMGAEYHGYTADVTRTFPVSGVFSPEQRTIYELVLAAQLAGINACRPGNDFKAPHHAAEKTIQEGLMRLGIISEPSESKRYFPHGTSHFLGLDVHDVGTTSTLKKGHVITVEPGIYIPADSPCDKKWWNIGIRIEDDILITEAEPLNLSEKLEKSPAAIENLMKEAFHPLKRP